MLTRRRAVVSLLALATGHRAAPFPAVAAGPVPPEPIAEPFAIHGTVCVQSKNPHAEINRRLAVEVSPDGTWAVDALPLSSGRQPVRLAGDAATPALTLLSDLGAGLLAGARPSPWRAPDPVREVDAFLSVRDPETGERRDAELVIGEYDDGSWCVEANPHADGESCDDILFLPPHRDANAALAGLLGMVLGLAATAPIRPHRPTPTPEIVVGPTLAGGAVLDLRGGEGNRASRKFGNVRAKRINGTWVIVAGPELGAWLDATWGAEPTYAIGEAPALAAD